MKPGNLFESGANTGSKSKLNDERENDTENSVYSLELFRRVHFFCPQQIRRLYQWRKISYSHQSP